LARDDDTEGGANPDRRGIAGGDPAALFLRHLEFIHAQARRAARRRGFDPAETEDFEGEIHLKLIANDYDVVRRFRERSLFTTYLVSVIEHALLDFMDKRWGKWRPSSLARRRGETACLVDRLVRCLGFSVDEVVARLQSLGTRMDRGAVADLVAMLPVRVQRSPAGEDRLDSVPSPHAGPDSGLEQTERQRVAGILEAQLGLAISRLPTDDRALLRLAFVDRLSIPAIATRWNAKPRALYTRLQHCKAAIRRDLEAAGLEAATVREFLSDSKTGLREVASMRREPGDGGIRPSHPSESPDET
jgi:RNA polymerase sigma factor (sigma-70 family)